MNSKKLYLNKETLRTLSDENAGLLNGGAVKTSAYSGREFSGCGKVCREDGTTYGNDCYLTQSFPTVG